MMWFQENLSTIVVGLILLAIVGLIIRSLVTKKTSACSCGCDGCPHSGACHHQS